MKIRCQFLGCKGIIDLDKEFKNFQEELGYGNEKQKIKKIPWCYHGLICPKCGNSIGTISLHPDVFITLGSSGDATIHDATGKTKGIIIEGWKKHKRLGIKKLLNPYLKDWAKVK